VADALYFYGEGAPNDLAERENLKPNLPDGYDYDGCDATTLRTRLSVRDGCIVLPDGMTYHVLILPDSVYMTPRVAESIHDLVRAGATVVGPKPQKSPSLSGGPQADERLRNIAEEVWGNVDGRQVTEHTLGRGRILSGKTLQEVLDKLRVPRDFEYSAEHGPAKLAYIHRVIGDADVYFVSNQLYRPSAADCTFRVHGREPELWNPETGAICDAPIFREENGRTIVSLDFDPAESLFLVFRKPAAADHLTRLELVSSAGSSTSTLPQIRIQKALYESTDSLKSIDITSTVSRMVANGVYEIPATTEYWGDPAKGHVKQLRIDYTMDGKQLSTTVGERAVALLADITRTAPLPPFSVTAAQGGIQIGGWNACTIHYATAGDTTKTLEIKEPARSVDITSPWSVKFPPHSAAPDQIELQRLVSWTESPTSGVRYFSGTATYSAHFDVPTDFAGAEHLAQLDLGVVKNFATVRLNGKEIGVLWKAPYRVDISSVLQPGSNQLEIQVTSLWPNRLIGDEQLPPDAEYRDDGSLAAWPDWLLQKKPRPSGRVAFSTWKFYDKDSPLMESGLIGPVTVRSCEKVVLAP
jgi:hypothetical protein